MRWHNLRDNRLAWLLALAPGSLVVSRCCAVRHSWFVDPLVRPRIFRCFRARCSRPRVRGLGTRPGCPPAPPDRLRGLREYRRGSTFLPCFGHESPAGGKQPADVKLVAAHAGTYSASPIGTRRARARDGPVALRFVRLFIFYKYHAGGISLAGIGATRNACAAP